MDGQTKIKFTHFVFNNFSSKMVPSCEIMWTKYYRAGQATDVNVAHAYFTLGT